ncbi:hypothetical protein JTB14_027633 [Gonioctena quinquepunctata]|nr:hypothetical protein JTB14_027633 [Gonioctena quinquepunctata]
MPLLQFRIELAKVLTTIGSSNVVSNKRGRPSNTSLESKYKKRKHKEASPPFETRTDGIGHWPQHSQQRNRCRLDGCNGKSRMFCSKCNGLTTREAGQLKSKDTHRRVEQSHLAPCEVLNPRKYRKETSSFWSLMKQPKSKNWCQTIPQAFLYYTDEQSCKSSYIKFIPEYKQRTQNWEPNPGAMRKVNNEGLRRKVFPTNQHHGGP